MNDSENRLSRCGNKPGTTSEPLTSQPGPGGDHPPKGGVPPDGATAGTTTADTPRNCVLCGDPEWEHTREGDRLYCYSRRDAVKADLAPNDPRYTQTFTTEAA